MYPYKRRAKPLLPFKDSLSKTVRELLIYFGKDAIKLVLNAQNPLRAFGLCQCRHLSVLLQLRLAE